MSQNIEDLSSAVPMGQARTFEAPLGRLSDNRFVEVHYAHEHGPLVYWEDKPSFTNHPWMGARSKTRIGLESIRDPKLTYEQRADQLIDFYSTGTGAFLISGKLLQVIEHIDQGSLEIVRVSVETRTDAVPFNLVMPLRNISAVDVSRTTVSIKDEELGPQWFRSVHFPDGVVFDGSKLAGVENFSDIDAVNRWFWSTDLVEAARAAGIKGLFTRAPMAAKGKIDRL